MEARAALAAVALLVLARCGGHAAEARAGDVDGAGASGITGIPLQMMLASARETGSSGLNCERDGYFINSFNASQVVVRAAPPPPDGEPERTHRNRPPGL